MDLNLNSLSVDENGRVSFSGLSSGIDFQKAVDDIITARKIPVDTLQTRVDENKLRIAALEDLRSGLTSLQQSLATLYGKVSFANSENVFEKKSAFTSASRLDGLTASDAANLLGVTVTNAAALGEHTIEILQTAKAHKVSSDAIASTSSTLGFSDGEQIIVNGQLAYRSDLQGASSDPVGSTGTITFTDVATGEAIGTVDYDAADTLQALATAITDNVTGVTAKITNESGQVRLVVTGDDRFTMAETGGGSALTDLAVADRNVITLTAGDTLLDLRDRINAANQGDGAIGVTASIVSVGASENYLLLTKDATGEAMTLADVGAGDALQSLGILTAGGAVKNELQAAAKARFYADGLLDSTNTAYESALQSSGGVLLGSSGTLDFTRDSDGSPIGSVIYNSGDSLSDLAAAITANVTGVTATVVSDGAMVRLKITGSEAFSFADSGSAAADLGLDNARRVVERESNTVGDLFGGITLNLFQAEQGTTLTVSLERDLSAIKTQIAAFVDAYNNLRGFVNLQRISKDKATQDQEGAGVLIASRALATVQSQLALILGRGAVGVSKDFSVLQQIGIDFVDNDTVDDPLLKDTLTLDEPALDEALLNNADDIRRLFGFDFSSSDPRVRLLQFSGDTTYDADGYTLNIQPGHGDNQILHSETLDDAYWTASELTVSADAATAPDGNATAEGLVASVNALPHTLSNGTAVSVAGAGTTYSYSAYVKAGASDSVRLYLNAPAGQADPNLAFAQNAYAEFDLTTGTVTTTGAGLDGATIEDVGDGWYRVNAVATSTQAGDLTAEITPMRGAADDFAGDGATVDTYVWGAQVQELASGTTPGNYAATTTATVAAVAASANIDGAADGSDDGSATLNNGTITVNTGGAKGLQLFYSGFSAPSSVQLDFTVGMGAQMFFKIDELLDTKTGAVETESDALSDQNDTNQDRIDEMLARLETQRQELLARFVRMETALATATRILDSIKQTTDAWFASKN